MDQINQSENSSQNIVNGGIQKLKAPEKLLGLELETYRNLSLGLTNITFLTMSNILLNPFDRLKTVGQGKTVLNKLGYKIESTGFGNLGSKN